MNRDITQRQFLTMVSGDTKDMVRALIWVGRNSSHLSEEEVERNIVGPAANMLEQVRPGVLKKISRLADRLADLIG